MKPRISTSVCVRINWALVWKDGFWVHSSWGICILNKLLRSLGCRCPWAAFWEMLLQQIMAEGIQGRSWEDCVVRRSQKTHWRNFCQASETCVCVYFFPNPVDIIDCRLWDWSCFSLWIGPLETQNQNWGPSLGESLSDLTEWILYASVPRLFLLFPIFTFFFAPLVLPLFP